MALRRKNLIAAMFALALPLLFTRNAVADEKFIPINPPQPTSTTNKVEVVEVFSYGCIHCARFQQQVDAYLKRMDPKKVEFVYLPATFRGDFTLLARGFYAADELGVVKKTHQGVFNAIFEKNMQFRTFNDVVAIYQSLGINADDFLKAAQSFSVESKVRRANDLMTAYAVTGTPTIIVNGKYSVTGDSAGAKGESPGEMEKIFAVVDELVKKEYAAMKH
jgi:protein dithiol oxidoreductase (disulfide-forming)